MYSDIIYMKKDRVAVLTMNRPQIRNALSFRMAMEMIDALKKADADPEVGAVVLRGEGRAFCAGGDISEFATVTEKGSVEIYLEGVETTELFLMGDRMQKPLVAAVNGMAMGGGIGLIAMCHLAIASDTAKLGLTEINLAFFPYVVLPLVMRAVGYRKALELSLTGVQFDAFKAKEIGLVNDVVPAEKLDEEVLNIAGRMSQRSPLALRMGLSGALQASKMPVAEAAAHMNILRTVAFKSNDLEEGVRAFLEKRQPAWQSNSCKNCTKR
ncbi:MAG: enoyl-CoA hydratase/isomerase family protein [Dethiobacter sp.]|nr:enoyl-CoA hydratase/isomerase family protein [Dethiobacter sp.]